MSGGMVWLPNNPLMRADGIADSFEDGMAYFDDVIGDVGPASSPARREMFLHAGVEMIDFLQRKGVRMTRCPGYSDYYPNSKGGNAAGRSVEGVPFDCRRARRVERPSSAVHGQELRVRAQDERAALGAVLQSIAARVRGGDASVRCAPGPLGSCVASILTNGASLIGQILKALLDDGNGDPPRVDERRDGRPHRRGRPGRRRSRSRVTARRCNVRSAQGGAACCGRLRPQRRHAPPVQCRPAQRGEVVDRQRGRHR